MKKSNSVQCDPGDNQPKRRRAVHSPSGNLSLDEVVAKQGLTLICSDRLHGPAKFYLAKTADLLRFETLSALAEHMRSERIW